ncbi:MAG: YlmC/YmxH family sporulation protein [Clostridia bacterium]
MQNSCTISDLRHKEIINLHNGMRLGYICDAEIDILTGNILSLVVPGELRFFGLLGRGDDIIIPWDKIDRIGDDIVIINYEFTSSINFRVKKSWFNF